MPIDNKELIRKAFIARENAYAPYSGFCVGAAILCDDGDIVSGCNIENASYGLTVCAERCATFKAVSVGKQRFSAIAIVGGIQDEKDSVSGYAYPCGACRQVLREFADPKSMHVLVAKSIEDFKEYTLEELLPDSFGPSNLN